MSKQIAEPLEHGSLFGGVADPQWGAFKHGDHGMFVSLAADPNVEGNVLVQIGFLNETDGSQAPCWHPDRTYSFKIPETA